MDSFHVALFVLVNFHFAQAVTNNAEMVRARVPNEALKDFIFMGIDDDNDDTVTHDECLHYLNHKGCMSCIQKWFHNVSANDLNTAASLVSGAVKGASSALNLKASTDPATAEDICSYFEFGENGFSTADFEAKIQILEKQQHVVDGLMERHLLASRNEGDSLEKTTTAKVGCLR